MTVSEQDDVERRSSCTSTQNENRMNGFDEYYAEHYWTQRAIKEVV